MFSREWLQVVGFANQTIFLNPKPNADKDKQQWQSRSDRSAPQKQSSNWKDLRALIPETFTPLTQKINIQPSARTQIAPQASDLLNPKILENAILS
jgi:hypothetical protein